jgi:hypothetical protein
MVFRHFPYRCIIVCIRCRGSRQRIMWALSLVQRRDQLWCCLWSVVFARYIYTQSTRPSQLRSRGEWWVESGGDVLFQRGPLAEQSGCHQNCCYSVWTGKNDRFVCIYRVRTENSSHQPMMMRQRQSLKRRRPTLHWHGWSPEISLCIVSVKAWDSDWLLTASWADTKRPTTDSWLRKCRRL